MANTSSIYERCFVYSRTQADEMINLSKSNSIANNKFKLGTVVVNGSNREYTEIVNSLDKARYPDAILVIKGDIRKLHFTEPNF